MTTCYITKPHFSDLATQNLKYTDILTYVTISSFRNTINNNCFPAYETIAARMGASRCFVIQSVARLKKAVIIRTHKVAYLSNQYYFASFDYSDRVPFEFFNLPLTINEKAMLLLIRQFCVATPVETFSSYSEMAMTMGISYKTIYTQAQSLIKKGVLVENICRRTGKRITLKLAPVIDWIYKYDLPKETVPVEDFGSLIIT